MNNDYYYKCDKPTYTLNADFMVTKVLVIHYVGITIESILTEEDSGMPSTEFSDVREFPFAAYYGFFGEVVDTDKGMSVLGFTLENLVINNSINPSNHDVESASEYFNDSLKFTGINIRYDKKV